MSPTPEGPGFKQRFHQRFTEWLEVCQGIETLLRSPDRDEREDTLDAWGPIAVCVMQDGPAAAAATVAAIGVKVPPAWFDEPAN